MAAVRGVGFSSAVQEDIYFDRLRENLDAAEELGVEFVELPLFAMDLIAGGRVIQTQMHRLNDALKARSLGYTAHGPIGLNFMQAPEIAARHLTVAKAAIEAAAEIGAPHLVFHTGRTMAQTEAEIEDLYARQREALASLGDIAARHSIVIAVENIFPTKAGEHTALPSRLAREIETINHPNVRGCLDFSHATLTCAGAGVDFLTDAKELARVASHLHIHDSFGDPAQFWTFSAPSGSPTASATCICRSVGAHSLGRHHGGLHVRAGRDLQSRTSGAVLVRARRQCSGGTGNDRRLRAALRRSVETSANPRTRRSAPRVPGCPRRLRDGVTNFPAPSAG